MLNALESLPNETVLVLTSRLEAVGKADSIAVLLSVCLMINTKQSFEMDLELATFLQSVVS